MTLSKECREGNKFTMEGGNQMSLPNFPCLTLGGKFFWETVTSSKGWKLQRNVFTQHYRILDPFNIRHAWSLDEEQMRKIFHLYTIE